MLLTAGVKCNKGGRAKKLNFVQTSLWKEVIFEKYINPGARCLHKECLISESVKVDIIFFDQNLILTIDKIIISFLFTDNILEKDVF